jgi:hypothetical protein
MSPSTRTSRWGQEYDRRWPSAVEEAPRLCQRALEIDDRLEGEVWLSSLLGRWWRQSDDLRDWDWDAPEEEQADLCFLVAGPVIREVAAVGGAGAWAILHGVARLDTGRVARLAGDLADTLDAPGLDPPDWTRYLGERTPVRERSQRRPNGNEVIALELRHVLDEPRWLGISTAGWGSCLRIELYRSFDQVEDFARSVARKNAKELPFEELPAGEGCQRAQKALCRGHAGHGKEQDRFVELRAWALAMTTPRMTDRDRRLHRARLDRLDIDESGWCRFDD